jgi:clan AA aspartic protease
MTPTAVLEVTGIRGTVRMTAIIDTGFNGYVCVPKQDAVRVGLELSGSEYVELADGTVKEELQFQATVRFLGENRVVDVSLTNSADALIGTALLSDCRLAIDFTSGTVRLTRKKGRRGGRRS